MQASVVIIFYNELLSVILRTIWSVILQTPEKLLHEIILVDDASTDSKLLFLIFLNLHLNMIIFLEYLHHLLQHYLQTRLKKYRVSLLKQNHRLGLIRARLHGARAATGDVLIFLDAHCETTTGWIEPLLARIEEERTAVLVPIIDVIEADTLAYSTNGTF